MNEEKVNAILEAARFIAELNPEKVIAFRPSGEVQKRIKDLILKEKNSFLQSDEKSDLDQFLVLEHLMRLAKAIAHLRIKNG